jgi:hypothetical protein
MAAGVIYQTVTTTGSETVELGFYVDETGAPTTWTNETHLAAGTNAIGKLAANSGVDIGDVDVTSVIPGTGATNLGKAIDTATGATDTGVLMLATRDDSLSSLTPADGDNVQLRVNSTGQLHTYATIDATQLGSLGQTTGSASVPVVLPTDWVGAVGPMKLEDVASAAGDAGIPAMAVEQTTPANTGGTNGDWGFLQMQAGHLWTYADGSIAHDTADSGNPVKIGLKGISHGTNPTGVTANDRTNWYSNVAGIPFVMAGHPNIITKSATIDDADGAQTDASLLTIAGGSKIVITSIGAVCSSSNSGSVAVRIGFGAANVPAASEAGTAAVLLEGKFSAGGGWQRGNGSGILGIGADGEDLRITCDDPAGGSLFVTFSYYTIES